jgi:2-haloacid dehalogenase
MSLDPDRVETITVDSYGTLVDPFATDRALRERVPDEDADAVSREWRARSITYTMVGNAVGFYQPFYEMNRDALEFALDARGVALPDDEVDAILSVYHDLEVYDDVRDGVGRLREGGYDVYVLSNGNPEMLASMVENAGIGGTIADTISAQEIELFKPEPEIYRHAAARTGTSIDRVLHVAGPSFDVLGAMTAGMQAAWLNREGEPWEDFADRSPDLRAETFHDVAEALGV